jgi:thioredoxin-related protein
MKTIFILLLSFFYTPAINWHNNMDEARQLAKQEHKYILLNFSGSDWCGPCIRLQKEIFGTSTFQHFATTNLVLVNADFPRLKRNQLPAAQQKINDAIAEQYNSKGSFPLTLLLSENGNVLKEWDGFPKGTADEFVGQIQWVIDHNKIIQ